MNPKRALLDTNALLNAKNNFNVVDALRQDYPHLELLILEGTLKELTKLEAEGKGSEKANASLAKQLIKRQDLKIVPQSVEYVDKALLEEALKEPSYILTLDRELQKKALDLGIKVLGVAKHSQIHEIVS